jgi:hypothetical protein
MMVGENDPEMITKFYDTINLHDGYRNESFVAVFPELHKLLSNNEL